MLEAQPPDILFRSADIAGKLSSVSGGEAEATARAIYARLSGSALPASKLHRFRGHKPFREVSLKMGETSVRVGIVSGLANAVKLIDELLDGKKRLDYLEVMACPGGCINGGGQPIPAKELSLRARTKALFDLENGGQAEAAPETRSVREFYEESMGGPGGKRARELFHTSFTPRGNH
jgi:iron only hydrogenase large subunit-like protein